MQDNANSELPAPKWIPWNKGKLTGAKPPLRQKHVWAIRTKLQIEQRTRDLALFNLAIDSKLRGCDVVALKVEDVAPNGYSVDRATVRQRKTGRPVRFELTEQTRQAVDDYIRTAGKKPGEFLFTACRKQEHRMTTRQYARLLSEWAHESAEACQDLMLSGRLQDPRLCCLRGGQPRRRERDANTRESVGINST